MQDKIVSSVLKNRDLTKDEVRAMVVRDLQSVHVVVTELLNSDSVLDAFTEVFWARYLQLHSGSND